MKTTLRLSSNILILAFFFSSTLCIGEISQISILKQYDLESNDIKRIEPFLIPDQHPLKIKLDSIFINKRPTKDLKALLDSGFIPHSFQHCSMIVVTSHPTLERYLIKLNLDSEMRKKKNMPSWQWLVRRLEGAKSIRKIISEENIKYFIIPKKWLYVLPKMQDSPYPQKELIVIEEKIDIVSKKENLHAWKKKITKKHLQELHTILDQALPITPTALNIPYTKQGLFAFVDTEVKYRTIHTKFEQTRGYLSKKMGNYWDSITTE